MEGFSNLTSVILDSLQVGRLRRPLLRSVIKINKFIFATLACKLFASVMVTGGITLSLLGVPRAPHGSGYILWVVRFTPIPTNLIKPSLKSRPQGVTYRTLGSLLP